jgi:hypothetical protein
VLGYALAAVVLYPFWDTILSTPRWRGCLAVASVVFVAGYVAASGGMIEHFVWFEPTAYPVRFAAITFVEVLGQALIMGQLVVRLGARYCAR